MIKYYDLGSKKSLNEIVMAGSHDAGINAGAKNVRTQGLNIYQQAESGIRIFDMRITGAVVKRPGAADALTLKAYHGQGGKRTEQAHNLHTNKHIDVKVRDMTLGDYGMEITSILTEAKRFVKTNPTEFLLLKFDKSDNWLLIAEACVRLLQETIYCGGGNLNCAKLLHLRGRVIVLFPEAGQKEVHHLYGIPQGILGWKNLQGGGSYKEDFHGLQYFGKGGTSVTNVFGSKIKENLKKQKKLIERAGDGNPKVMGMMYWTTTGLTESIRKRNDKMWTPPHIAQMQNLWKNGMRESVTMRVNPLRRLDGLPGAHVIKAFMPNFVMIDFSDAEKCKHVYQLNFMSPSTLANAVGGPAQV
ncbi:MAG: hypothetical protein WA803_19620 [Steroidobacteraceae bacterium]